MKKSRLQLGTVVFTLVLFALLLWQARNEPRPAAGADDLQSIASAFAERRSDVWVESSGTVVKILRDDTEGSAHQRFLVELSNGQTLLFAHNIDLAPRVPLVSGKQVSFRGEYEWNEKGGVIHWTHHDPSRRHEGGWIEYEGQRYR